MSSLENPGSLDGLSYAYRQNFQLVRDCLRVPPRLLPWSVDAAAIRTATKLLRRYPRDVKIYASSGSDSECQSCGHTGAGVAILVCSLATMFHFQSAISGNCHHINTGMPLTALHIEAEYTLPGDFADATEREMHVSAFLQTAKVILNQELRRPVANH